MPRVAIIHGFGEGPAITKGMQTALKEAGFAVTKKPAEADIIIAHSGGCFLIPQDHQAKMILLIGPALWPNRRLVANMARKVSQEFRAYKKQKRMFAWFKKNGWNMVYAGNLRRNLAMHRALRSGAGYRVAAPRLVLVRDRYDAFCTPLIAREHFMQEPAMVSIIGEHDDCWVRPIPYIDIVQSIYGT